MGRAFSQNGEGRSAFIILTGRPIRRRPLGRPWHSWGTIRIDLKGMVSLRGSVLIQLRIGITGEPL